MPLISCFDGRECEYATLKLSSNPGFHVLIFSWVSDYEKDVINRCNMIGKISVMSRLVSCHIVVMQCLHGKVHMSYMNSTFILLGIVPLHH